MFLQFNNCDNVLINHGQNHKWSKITSCVNIMHLMFPAFVCYDSHDCSLSLWLRLRWLYCSSNQSPAADRRSKVRSQSRARWADLQSLHRPRLVHSKYTTDTKYFLSSALKVILVTFTETDCRGEQLLANYDGAGTKQVFQNFFG